MAPEIGLNRNDNQLVSYSVDKQFHIIVSHYN